MNISGVLIRCAAVLCLLQGPLQDAVPLFSYFDELLMVGLGLCFVLKTLSKHKIVTEDLLAIGCILLLLIYGLLCNILSGIQRPTPAVFQDFMTLPKMFICYLGAKYLFCDRDDCWKILDWVSKFVSFMVLSGLACLVLAYIGVFDMFSRSTRMGMHCFEFIYGSPGMLSQYCVLYVTVLIANIEQNASNKFSWVIWGLSLVLWASTLRTRAFVMILLIVFLTLVVFRPGLRSKFQGKAMLRKLTSPLVLVPAASVGLLVSLDQIDHYFGGLESARSYLLDGGIKVFNEYFPFGAGFATYGTEAARSFYSPLYSQYGVNTHWALGSDGSELTDTFWPAVMAEFGLIGVVLYIIPLFIVLRRIVKACSSRRFLLTSAVSFVAYTLIASTATGVYFSSTISCCMLFIGLILGCASCHAEPNLPASTDQKGSR